MRITRGTVGPLTVIALAVLAPGMGDAARGEEPRMLATCLPVSQRTGPEGCWIMAQEALGPLPQTPLFWHLSTFPTRAAAEAAKGPGATVMEALDQVWMFSIGAARAWTPGGKSVAEIGPLPVKVGAKYTAQYMEAIFAPGAETRPHTHPGARSLVSRRRGRVSGDPRRQGVRTGGGQRIHRARRSADAAHGDREGRAPLDRVDPARDRETGQQPRHEVGTEGVVPRLRTRKHVHGSLAWLLARHLLVRFGTGVHLTVGGGGRGEAPSEAECARNPAAETPGFARRGGAALKRHHERREELDARLSWTGPLALLAASPPSHTEPGHRSAEQKQCGGLWNARWWWSAARSFSFKL